MSAVQLIRSDTLTDAVDYAYSAAAEQGARLVLTAGACPLDSHGVVVAPGDVAAQAAKVMDNLEQALADAGTDLTNVMRTTVYVASSDRSDLTAAWDVVRARMADHDVPSTLLGVTVLGYRDQLVEVEAIAVAHDQLADSG